MSQRSKVRKHRRPISKPKRSFSRSSHKPRPAAVTYELNTAFEFFYELQDLILKSSPAQKDRMMRNINRLGRIKMAVISGIFLNKERADAIGTDLLLVGEDIDRRKLKNFLASLEAEVGKEVSFVIMDKEEFQYRLAMFDRYTRVMIEGPHEKLINKLGL